MRKKEISIFKFNELSEELKQKVLQDLSDINVDYEWWRDDYLLDPPDCELSSGMEVMFSWSSICFDLYQGACLQFENLVVEDEDAFLKYVGLQEYKDIIGWEFNNPGGTCNYNTEIEFFIDGDEDDIEDEEKKKIYDLIEEAENIFDDMVKDAFKRLSDEHDYLLSDEAIIETIEANEYEFTEKGELIPVGWYN